MKCAWPTCRDEQKPGKEYCFLHNKVYGSVESKPPPKKIASQSEPEKDRQKEYRKARKEHLKEKPICEVKGCRSPASEVHHMEGRIGYLLTDKSNFISICPECHRKIEDNPQWAKENNYSKPRINKNASTKN